MGLMPPIIKKPLFTSFVTVPLLTPKILQTSILPKVAIGRILGSSLTIEICNLG